MIRFCCFCTTPMAFRVFSQHLAPSGCILFIVCGVLAWHLTRLRLVLARPQGGLLAGGGGCLWSGSCWLLSVCLWYVLQMVTQCKGMIAHPLGCPPQFPFCFFDDCLHHAQTLCLFHFVLHNSGRAHLPLLPGVIQPPCDGLRSVVLADCV